MMFCWDARTYSCFANALPLFPILAEMMGYHPPKRGATRKRTVVKPARRPQLTEQEKGKVEAWREEKKSQSD